MGIIFFQGKYWIQQGYSYYSSVKLNALYVQTKHTSSSYNMIKEFNYSVAFVDSCMLENFADYIVEI